MLGMLDKIGQALSPSLFPVQQHARPSVNQSTQIYIIISICLLTLMKTNKSCSGVGKDEPRETTMEKITDKIAALPNHGTYFSLEFFPPKTDMV